MHEVRRRSTITITITTMHARVEATTIVCALQIITSRRKRQSKRNVPVLYANNTDEEKTNRDF